MKEEMEKAARENNEALRKELELEIQGLQGKFDKVSADHEKLKEQADADKHALEKALAEYTERLQELRTVFEENEKQLTSLKKYKDSKETGSRSYKDLERQISECNDKRARLKEEMDRRKTEAKQGAFARYFMAWGDSISHGIDGCVEVASKFGSGVKVVLECTGDIVQAGYETVFGKTKKE